MSDKRLTIRDVARVAGVSTQTVSRVINHRPDVAAATRAHVKEVIAELGYAPNIIARNLSRGRSNTLGVIGYGLEYYGSTSVLRGIERRANELGYSLLLSLIDRVEPERVDHILYELLSHQVEGLIWAVPGNVNAFSWLHEKFCQLQIPSAQLNSSQIGDELVVAMNNRLGGRLATQHLLDQGYQRVGIITGPAYWWESMEREAGWRAVLEENGFSDLDDLKAVGDWNAATGDVGLQTLLTQVPDLDAVFVCNDQMALGTLQAARRLGLKVPKDLGVVGFDDIPESAYFYPPLTTVRQNARKLGALAVQRITALIKARDDNQTIPAEISWVDPRLVVRQSSQRKG
jgi:LacI family transcriptional regulator